MHLQALDWLSLLSVSPDLQNQRLPAWLSGAARCWEYPSSFHCRKGIIFMVFFCTSISSCVLPKATSLAYLHLRWISDRLPQAMQPISRQGGLLLDSLIPLVASLLEIFSWPFTSLSDWLCIWHRFLPNCPSQHELLSCSASHRSPSFPTIKEHTSVGRTGKLFSSCCQTKKKRKLQLKNCKKKVTDSF